MSLSNSSLIVALRNYQRVTGANSAVVPLGDVVTALCATQHPALLQATLRDGPWYYLVFSYYFDSALRTSHKHYSLIWH